MAPGSDRRSSRLDRQGLDRQRLDRQRLDRQRLDRRELERYTKARNLFEGRSPVSPVENVMERNDYRRIADAQARRNPRISEPRTPETFVRRGVNEVLENPAKPSFEEPGKAFMPGGICLDPLLLTLLAIRLMRDPEALWEGSREAQRKDKPGR